MGFIVEQVRRRRMALEYSLIWIIAGLGMIILSLWKNGVEFIAHIMGIFYAPSAIFVLLGVIMLALCIHFSLAISKLSTQNRILVQKLALLEYELGKDKEKEEKADDNQEAGSGVAEVNEIEQS